MGREVTYGKVYENILDAISADPKKKELFLYKLKHNKLTYYVWSRGGQSAATNIRTHIGLSNAVRVEMSEVIEAMSKKDDMLIPRETEDNSKVEEVDIRNF